MSNSIRFLTLSYKLTQSFVSVLLFTLRHGGHERRLVAELRRSESCYIPKTLTLKILFL